MRIWQRIAFYAQSEYIDSAKMIQIKKHKENYKCLLLVQVQERGKKETFGS